MALSKKIKMTNGIELNYHIINNIEVTKDNIKVSLDSFTSKSYFESANKRSKLLANQNELVNTFNELEQKEELTKTQEAKLDKLANDINKLADDINATKEYDNFVLGKITIIIPYIENFSHDLIEKELLNTKEFNLAKIVK